MKLTIAYKGKEHDFESSDATTVLDVKEHVRAATQLPPEALKLFFRGRPRADTDKLLLIGVKQFSKLVLVGNPAYKRPGGEEAGGEGRASGSASGSSADGGGAADSGATKSKFDALIDSVQPLLDEAASAIAAGKVEVKVKLKLTELLTQKMLALDAVEVHGDPEKRERRKKALLQIEQTCTDIENL